jgi:hypothetical protein
MREWKQSEISYLHIYRTTCELCGQLVPARHWAAEVDGEPRRFCNEEHENLSCTYWIPRHGRGAA